MDFEDVKGYFTGPNIAMVAGAVGGFALGTYLGKFITGKVGVTGFQKALVSLLTGLGTGAVAYAIGRSMEPGSSWKPAVYGVAIGAALPGVIEFVASLMSSNESTKPIVPLLFGNGFGTQNIQIENV